mmetsp:Transcript_6118/g.9153  ORF Transcript_6118/g.9153 Transcript_6118/m.9153 type:complete len:275 (+) Transcript_6118:300-1124(+)
MSRSPPTRTSRPCTARSCRCVQRTSRHRLVSFWRCCSTPTSSSVTTACADGASTSAATGRSSQTRSLSRTVSRISNPKASRPSRSALVCCARTLSWSSQRTLHRRHAAPSSTNTLASPSCSNSMTALSSSRLFRRRNCWANSRRTCWVSGARTLCAAISRRLRTRRAMACRSWRIRCGTRCPTTTTLLTTRSWELVNRRCPSTAACSLLVRGWVVIVTATPTLPPSSQSGSCTSRSGARRTCTGRRWESSCGIYPLPTRAAQKSRRSSSVWRDE